MTSNPIRSRERPKVSLGVARVGARLVFTSEWYQRKLKTWEEGVCLQLLESQWVSQVW